MTLIIKTLEWSLCKNQKWLGSESCLVGERVEIGESGGLKRAWVLPTLSPWLNLCISSSGCWFKSFTIPFNKLVSVSLNSVSRSSKLREPKEEIVGTPSLELVTAWGLQPASKARAGGQSYRTKPSPAEPDAVSGWFMSELSWRLTSGELFGVVCGEPPPI